MPNGSGIMALHIVAKCRSLGLWRTSDAI